MTGGTGFFDKGLLDRCRTFNAEWVVLSRNPHAFLPSFPTIRIPSKVTFIPGDIRDFKFPGGPFDYVIHAATEACTQLERENLDEFYSVIVEGSRRVLEFSKQAGIRRLLYVSSGGVYGIQPPELSHLPETFPCNPVTVYGKGKWQAEQLCLESGIETVIARGFAFVGPWLPLDAHFAIGNFIGNGLRNEPIQVHGDGTPMRSYPVRLRPRRVAFKGSIRRPGGRNLQRRIRSSHLPLRFGPTDPNGGRNNLRNPSSSATDPRRAASTLCPQYKKSGHRPRTFAANRAGRGPDPNDRLAPDEGLPRLVTFKLHPL